ncbi:MAG: FIST C-terminal domain-containing protein [Leptospira sp.]|nr:FIST C-terminal domain-containing protein [Leptospira sp.]
MSIYAQIFTSNSSEEFIDQFSSTIFSNPKLNLALIFASDSYLTEGFTSELKKSNIHIFGTSSREEISGNKLSQGSVSAMLLNLNDSAFRLKRFQGNDSFELGKSITEWARSEFLNPALMMIVGGGGFTIKSEILLSGIFSTGLDIPVYGGIASMLSNLTTSYSFDSEGMFQDGVLVLALDREKIDIQGMAVSGWKEVGTPKRITKSLGNKVYEIEGMPATEFYERYFKVSAGKEEDLLAVMEYPLLVSMPNGSRVMRTPIQLEAVSKSVIYAADIPQNAEVRFCSPNIAETIEAAVEEVQTFRDSNNLGAVDAVILFDCAIRSQSFGTYMKKEIEFISTLWNAPIAGFSSWGEIGNRRGETCGLHNTTISLVLLRDKNSESRKGSKFYTRDSIHQELNEFEVNADPNEMRKNLQSLRKQKTMLSHFLHLNSDDLDQANSNLAIERHKSEKLLLNILPESIAERLKSGETKIADQFDNVTVLFADLVGFTSLSGKLNASEIVRILNLLFRNFDSLCDRYGIEKIKTIGDAYMAATGLPIPSEDHVFRIVKLAKGMLKCLQLINDKENINLNLRIGFHSGSVVAGVIGKNKFIYDLWGDTVNIASRMESHGIPGRIHLSDASAKILMNKIPLEKRGEIEIKGKGKMTTWLLPE